MRVFSCIVAATLGVATALGGKDSESLPVTVAAVEGTDADANDDSDSDDHDDSDDSDDSDEPAKAVSGSTFHEKMSGVFSRFRDEGKLLKTMDQKFDSMAKLDAKRTDAVYKKLVADRARRETQRDNAYSRRPVEVAPDLRAAGASSFLQADSIPTTSQEVLNAGEEHVKKVLKRSSDFVQSERNYLDSPNPFTAAMLKTRDHELKHEKALARDVAALRREGVSFLESDARIAEAGTRGKYPTRSFLPLMEKKHSSPVEDIVNNMMKKLTHFEHLEYAKFERESKANGYDLQHLHRRMGGSLLQADPGAKDAAADAGAEEDASPAAATETTATTAKADGAATTEAAGADDSAAGTEAAGAATDAASDSDASTGDGEAAETPAAAPAAASGTDASAGEDAPAATAPTATSDTDASAADAATSDSDAPAADAAASDSDAPAADAATSDADAPAADAEAPATAAKEAADGSAGEKAAGEAGAAGEKSGAAAASGSDKSAGKDGAAGAATQGTAAPGSDGSADEDGGAASGPGKKHKPFKLMTSAERLAAIKEDEAKNFRRSRAVEERIRTKLKTIEANNAAERAKLAAEEKADAAAARSPTPDAADTDVDDDSTDDKDDSI